MSTRPQRPKLAYCLDKEANFWKNGFGERPILEGRMPLSDSVPCSGGAAESASGKGGRLWADAWP